MWIRYPTGGQVDASTGHSMTARIVTWAFEGCAARRVDVQAQLTDGLPSFVLVGLADKAVGESRERVRAAFAALGLALPPKRLIVNLAPADLPKEGSHYDLPIAAAVLCAMGVLPQDALDGLSALGELSLDGRIVATNGALPAAIAAADAGLALLCPADCGSEAAWADGAVLAAPSLMAFINHVRGLTVLTPPAPGVVEEGPALPDLADVRGQERAKRCLEIAAAGGHNLLMIGPPGSGKSMLAARLPGLLPPLTASELLDLSMVHSVAGLIAKGALTRSRPFRSPHHSASMAALIGGGTKAKPGEASLAHHGVLFLDELPEFNAQALDALRQPLETGEIQLARANRHVVYPAAFQLVAAMNPCRCGGAPGALCRKVPHCQADYQARVSGPLYDRFDLVIETPPVTPADLALPRGPEGTREAAARVAAARTRQNDRAEALGAQPPPLNARLQGAVLEAAAPLDAAGRSLMDQAALQLRLSARGYHRTLKVARTIADLDGAERIARLHVAEALSYRRVEPAVAKSFETARL